MSFWLWKNSEGHIYLFNNPNMARFLGTNDELPNSCSRYKNQILGMRMIIAQNM
jgi:hypothetical protein